MQRTGVHGKRKYLIQYRPMPLRRASQHRTHARTRKVRSGVRKRVGCLNVEQHADNETSIRIPVVRYLELIRIVQAEWLEGDVWV